MSLDVVNDGTASDFRWQDFSLTDGWRSTDGGCGAVVSIWSVSYGSWQRADGGCWLTGAF